LANPPIAGYLAYAAGGASSSFLRMSLVVYASLFAASFAYLPIVFLVYGVNPLDETGLAMLMVRDSYSILVILSLWLLGYLVAFFFCVKCAFAFPTAAYDGSGASVRRSFAETRGSMWRLYFVFVLIFAPVVVVYFVAFLAAMLAYIVPLVMNAGGAPAVSSEEILNDLLLSPHIIVAGIVVYIAIMLSYVAMAAGAARAYQIRVERGLSGIAEVFA